MARSITARKAYAKENDPMPGRRARGKRVDLAEVLAKLHKEAVPPDRFNHRGLPGATQFCSHCGRPFNTKSAMEAHRLAKHAGKRKSRAKAPKPIWSTDVLRMHPLGRARRYARYARYVKNVLSKIGHNALDRSGMVARRALPAHMAEKGGVAR